MAWGAALPCPSCPLFLFFLSLFCLGCSITLLLRRCLILLRASAELPVQGRGTGRTESSSCQYQDKGAFRRSRVHQDCWVVH